MKVNSIDDLPKSGMWVLMPALLSDGEGSSVPYGFARLKVHPDICMKYTRDGTEEALIRDVPWAPAYAVCTDGAPGVAMRRSKWADVREEEFPVWVQERVSVLKTVASTLPASRGCLIVPGVGAFFYSSGVMWMNYPKEKANG